MSFFKKLRTPRQNIPPNCTLHDHSTSAAILDVSKPIPAFTPLRLPPAPNPPESTVVSPGRMASDAAQTFLPPIQAVADMIPGVGGVIKGVIGGMLSTLQLVDKYIQNKDDMEQLTLRLHLLLRLMENAPIARSTFEETMRRRLLSALETAKSQLEILEKRIRGSPSVTQEITGCITRINNHLLEYMVFALMYLQNDVNEIKTSTDKIARSNFEQIQFIENFMATAGTGRLPTVVSRGHVTLVDATGREHPMLLDQCRYLDQLDLMLHASLFRCRPDEAEIQRWYTKRKQYDFVIYNRTNSDVIQLTRESDIWSNMKPGARIVMRAITEEEVDSTVTTTYKCPCGTSHAVDVTVGNLVAALEHGCTITCQHCERRFQIAHTQRKQYATDNTKSVDGANPTPVAEANYLIRNFLAKQVNVQASLPETICCWRNPDDRICGAVLSWKSVLTHLRDSHGMN